MFVELILIQLVGYYNYVYPLMLYYCLFNVLSLLLISISLKVYCIIIVLRLHYNIIYII